MEPIISVRGLGKSYRIRTSEKKQYRTLRDDLSDGIKNILQGKFNKPETEEFWALRDINLDIYPGEVVGIIGRNGAGKSTLLKILARITQPTTGEAVLKGRVASLLEVGTGFHPELTGRENIFMSGTVLGMKRQEIKKNFDEIVAFAEVEKFLDTPVKRYSSGMYVRLAFAVAAHLETEILIIDEVLAVGDAIFQKKCLGKMGNISEKEGKSILFVSHNMTAIQTLCKRCAWVNSGLIVDSDDTNIIIKKYLTKSSKTQNIKSIWDDLDNAPGNEYVRWSKVTIYSDDESNTITVSTAIRVEFECWILQEHNLLNFSMHLYSIDGVRVFNTFSSPTYLSPGLLRATCFIPENLLNDETYTITIMVVKDASYILHKIESVLSFEVNDVPREVDWHGKWEGLVRPKINWAVDVIN